MTLNELANLEQVAVVTHVDRREQTLASPRTGRCRLFVHVGDWLDGHMRNVHDRGCITAVWIVVFVLLEFGRCTTQRPFATWEILGFLHSPDVAVEVLAYRPVFVLGMVERGGQFPYQPGMTVLSAVALAGGFNYRAVQDQVSVTRGAAGQAREYRAPRDATLLPGDVVTVFERQF